MSERLTPIRESQLPPGNSLRGRIGLVVSGSFLAMVLLTTVVVFLFTFRAEVNAWRGRQVEIARAGADRVDIFIERVETSLQMLSLLDPQGLEDDRAKNEDFLDSIVSKKSP